jgi:hypothetical protein
VVLTERSPDRSRCHRGFYCFLPDGGATPLSGGRVRVSVARPNLVVLAAEVALIVTVCCAARDGGAVYNPVEEIFPTAGLNVHVTAVLLVPVTVAVNCCVPPATIDAVNGLTVTDTAGVRVTVALADLLPSAADVAFTVTLVWAVTDAGAV